jgi:hypothetical protein
MVAAILVLVCFSPILAPAVGIWVWTRWIARHTAAPRFATAIGYVLGAVSALAVVAGVTSGPLLATLHPSSPPSEKARELAEGISEAMNCAALAVVVVLVGGVWLSVCTWKWRPTARKRLVLGALLVLVVVVAAVAKLVRDQMRRRGMMRTAEDIYMVNAIRVAQETFRAETGSYANVSTALAANQNTNHFALYPQAPKEPGDYDAEWGNPCPASACNAGLNWSILPVHVIGKVRFGYSTIAGGAGERPTVAVIIDGKPVSWPTPDKDWYIVTAVGDVDGSGVFTTLLATSWDFDLKSDPSAALGSK